MLFCIFPRPRTAFVRIHAAAQYPIPSFHTLNAKALNLAADPDYNEATIAKMAEGLKPQTLKP